MSQSSVERQQVAYREGQIVTGESYRGLFGQIWLKNLKPNKIHLNVNLPFLNTDKPTSFELSSSIPTIREISPTMLVTTL